MERKVKRNLETALSLKITQSADIYSFRILVLQLIMRVTLDEIQGIISSVIKNQQTKVSVVHQELRKDCKLDEAKDMTSFALKCIQSDAPKNRPTMTDVVEELEQIQTKAKAERGKKGGGGG
ncbi:hypothetical protein M5689_002530 [Euphorbia peplus]|nr:hypothetical protein M5689_002530 [Euphorbia peplus]